MQPVNLRLDFGEFSSYLKSLAERLSCLREIALVAQHVAEIAEVRGDVLPVDVGPNLGEASEDTYGIFEGLPCPREVALFSHYVAEVSEVHGNVLPVDVGLSLGECLEEAKGMSQERMRFIPLTQFSGTGPEYLRKNSFAFCKAVITAKRCDTVTSFMGERSCFPIKSIRLVSKTCDSPEAEYLNTCGFDQTPLLLQGLFERLPRSRIHSALNQFLLAEESLNCLV